MDKRITKLDKQKTYYKIFNIVGIGVLLTFLILFLFSKMLPNWFVDIMFWFWISLAIAFLTLNIIFHTKIKKNTQNTLKSKYLFDRELEKLEIKTVYKDCIMQEVEFKEDGFIFNGWLVNYNDVNVEYSIYGDNIMMHIYLKELENTNPLLIFIVNEDLYFCIKKFKITLDLLDREIDFLNMNYKK